MNQEGLSLIAIHLADIGLVALFLLCCIALGLRFLSVLRLITGRALEETVLAAGVGMGILGTCLLLLGAMGLYRGVGFGLLLALSLMAAAYERPRIARNVRSIASGFSEALWKQQVKLPTLVVYSAIAIVFLALASLPPVDWDSLMYHLEIPQEFLKTGWIHLPADNLHVSRTGLINLIYGPLLWVGSPAAPALLSASVALLFGASVYVFCTRFFDLRTAVLALIGLWGTTTILMTASTPRVDVTLVYFLFLSHYSLFLALSLKNHRFIHLAGLFGGFAFGVKFHAIPYLAALFPIILWMVYHDTRSYRKAVVSGVSFGGIAFLTAVPWLVKNWFLLGAPLYPLFAERILPPWLASLYGNDAIPESVPDEVFGYVWSMRQPFNLRDAFLSPGELTIEFEGMLYFLSPILLLSPLWLLSKSRLKLSWLAIPAFLYLIILLVPFPRTNLRYLLPCIPALTIVGFNSIVGIADRVLARGVRAAVLTFIAGIALLPSVLAMAVWLPYTGPQGHLFGSEAGWQFLRSHPEYGKAFKMMSEVNDRTGPDDRVLLLFEARGFYFSGDVLQDNLGNNWRLLVPILNTSPCLEGSGITHVVVNFATLRYYIDTGNLDTDVVGWKSFRTFAEDCLHYQWSNGYNVLYELQPGRHRSSPSSSMSDR